MQHTAYSIQKSEAQNETTSNNRLTARSAQHAAAFKLTVHCSKLVAILCLFLFSGCYSFKDVSIPPAVRTFHLDLIGNTARYVNPQLSPQITDKLRQKIVNQTRLSPAPENGHFEISGTITEYNVSTSGISPNSQTGQQTASISRLTVGIKLTLKNTLDPNDPKTNFEASVSRNFDFDANLSLTQAEPQLNESIIKMMVDEMFNRIFSNW
ncbi:LPS assembly lipoprotein LptE [Paraflavitalea speifideaquila]|uniref:LPS assembly lipoprotein LptE n=1 Tax=Paraflavitalea speifideaquila TaxID=3076558 RepID=UPI0028E78455|nr:LPS assembly lipoprotein LptE [Paraflavitalea speifideiaquila]